MEGNCSITLTLRSQRFLMSQRHLIPCCSILTPLSQLLVLLDWCLNASSLRNEWKGSSFMVAKLGLWAARHQPPSAFFGSDPTAELQVTGEALRNWRESLIEIQQVACLDNTTFPFHNKNNKLYSCYLEVHPGLHEGFFDKTTRYLDIQQQSISISNYSVLSRHLLSLPLCASPLRLTWANIIH